MPKDRLKTCPRCGMQDTTSFSSCRGCGTKYGAIIQKQKNGADDRLKLVLTIVAVVVLVAAWFIHGLNSSKDKELKTNVGQNTTQQ